MKGQIHLSLLRFNLRNIEGQLLHTSASYARLCYFYKLKIRIYVKLPKLAEIYCVLFKSFLEVLSDDQLTVAFPFSELQVPTLCGDFAELRCYYTMVRNSDCHRMIWNPS